MLFGALGLFSIIGMAMTERRNRRRLGATWHTMTLGSSVFPFAAMIGGRAPLRIDRPMIIALVVAALITVWLLAGGHAEMFGADPLAVATS